jgi:hypothetical protein
MVALLAACASERPAVPTPVASAPPPTGHIVISGFQVSITDPFALDAGSYTFTWSAWGISPSEPPCTHSADLVGPGGFRLNLAKSVQVPATGTTSAINVSAAEAGDYYLDVRSACAWQIEVIRT